MFIFYEGIILCHISEGINRLIQNKMGLGIYVFIGIIYTGIFVRSSTEEATVPRNNFSKVLWLWVPITITSACHSSAYSNILRAVSPSAKCVLTLSLLRCFAVFSR